jgi:hypothetical protein
VCRRWRACRRIWHRRRWRRHRGRRPSSHIAVPPCSASLRHLRRQMVGTPSPAQAVDGVSHKPVPQPGDISAAGCAASYLMQTRMNCISCAWVPASHTPCSAVPSHCLQLRTSPCPGATSSVCARCPEPEGTLLLVIETKKNHARQSQAAAGPTAQHASAGRKVQARQTTSGVIATSDRYTYGYCKGLNHHEPAGACWLAI